MKYEDDISREEMAKVEHAEELKQTVLASYAALKRKFTIGIQGMEKSGKTEFLCTLPNPLFLQFDTNVACLVGWGHPMIDFTAMEPKDAWDLFFNKVIPSLYNRDLSRLQEYVLGGEDIRQVESICLDSETFCFETMQDAIPIPRSAKGEPDTYKWYRVLRELKKQQYYKLMGLARPFPNDPTRPSFNVAISCHMKAEYIDVPGTDKRILNRWVPAIEGSFKDKFGAYAGSLFWCDKERKADVTTYFMHTKSPDKFKVADDSVGGKGVYKVLPPRIPNNWNALLTGWGIGNTK